MIRALLLVSAALLAPCASAATVVDDSGKTVTLPATTARVADGWYAHHALMMTLGAGDRIVATVNHPQSQPWMFMVQPSLNQAQAVNGTAFNVESLLAAKVDLVFTSTGDRQAQAYEQAGIPVVRVGFTDLPGLEHSMSMTATALQSPSAENRAKAYNAYLESSLAQVRGATAALTDAQRPRVLHIQSLNPLKVDGTGTLIDDWIKIAGGRNAATGLSGNMQLVSPEQVLAWQPDVIILAAATGEIAQAPAHDLLANLDAVKQGHVLRNPAGVFPWDRYGTEIALQIQWAAEQLHPGLFAGLDLNAQTRQFYRQFFDYSLSEAQAALILKGSRPVEATPVN